ncbi:biotin/lipoyl-containing protein [Conexibacter sp. CPCC 206217]|uniref:biotin/lipoyl-containing protein n=1 Tax=Conexibacter sp. CPCC 206217 TaxID=3064574 RepID=UPI0027205E5A|nr:biotin/lipoyl-containing protein [Conexibacter sp. CPCC 206217]MDO8210328.1 biotin/lipoyl-containing protein [Conexibacter sp. CPCC 206217]
MEEIFIPALGMAMEEATLVEWLRQPGDAVASGDPVAVVDTDKSTIDIEAEADGVLGPHLYEAGSTVPVGVAIGHILTAAEAQEQR